MEVGHARRGPAARVLLDLQIPRYRVVVRRPPPLEHPPHDLAVLDAVAPVPSLRRPVVADEARHQDDGVLGRQASHGAHGPERAEGAGGSDPAQAGPAVVRLGRDVGHRAGEGRVRTVPVVAPGHLPPAADGARVRAAPAVVRAVPVALVVTRRALGGVRRPGVAPAADQALLQRLLGLLLQPVDVPPARPPRGHGVVRELLRAAAGVATAEAVVVAGAVLPVHEPAPVAYLVPPHRYVPGLRVGPDSAGSEAADERLVLPLPVGTGGRRHGRHGLRLERTRLLSDRAPRRRMGYCVTVCNLEGLKVFPLNGSPPGIF